MSLPLYTQSHDDPALEQAITVAALRESARTGEGCVRCYRPNPAVAFGRSDLRRAGFDRAADAAEAAGFDTVIRAPGGHAVAYHQDCVVLDHVITGADARLDLRERFHDMSRLLVGAFAELGVEADIGALAGEYCEGEFSVHGGGVKLVGTAQRVIRGAALVSAVLVVSDPQPLREVLIEVYAALDLALDPSTIGAMSTVLPGVTVTEVQSSVLAAYAESVGLVHSPIPPSIQAAAAAIVGDHRRA